MLGERLSGDVRAPTESDIQGATASAWSGAFLSYSHVILLDAHNILSSWISYGTRYVLSK